MGASFSAPITLWSGYAYGLGANVQSGPNGEIYATWAEYPNWTGAAQNMGFAFSNDGGVSYTVSSAFAYHGIRIWNIGIPAFNNTRANDFPSMAVDKSCGYHRGRIYITDAEFDNGTSGNSVVRVRFSDDHGTTWSPGVKVCITVNNQCWMPWIAVDDETGLVSVVYYAMDQVGSFSTNTYVAYSANGGVSWSNIKVSDTAHIHAPIYSSPGYCYCGDYIGIASYGGKSYATWHDNRTGRWQVYISEVDYSNISPIVSSQTNLAIDEPSTINGNTIYQATNNIKSADVNGVTIGANANITFKAGKEIILNPGFFKTDPNVSMFLAEIQNVSGCETPGAQAYKSNKPVFNAGNGGANNSILNGKSGNKDIYAYPVPTTDYVTIGCYNSTDANYITITDMNGRKVLRMPINIFNGSQIRNTIDVSSLMPGYYFFTIDFKDNNYTGKFIKL